MPEPAPFRRGLLAPMLLGAILNPINSSILAVALIPIGAAFGAPASETIWLVTALYLATAVGQPLMGRLIDRYGPRTLYLAGTGLVGVAGALGTLAPQLWVLVVARVLLGLGTSAAYPASMSLLKAEARRTGVETPAGVLALLTVVSQVVAVVGPTFGGALIAAGDWRLVFLLNVPLSLACLVLGALILPKTSAPAARTRMDAGGVVLFTLALVGTMVFLLKPGVATLAVLAASGLAWGLFFRREFRHPDPFLPLVSLRSNRPLVLTYLRQLLGSFTMYSLLYGYAQWLEGGRGLGTAETGLLLIPLSGAAILVTAVTGRRPRVRGQLVAGGWLQLAGAASLFLVGAECPLVLLAGLGLLFGLPQGLLTLANQNAMYAQAPAAQIGTSAGLLRTFLYGGALSASAVNAAVYRNGVGTAGLHELAWVLAAASAALLLLVLLDPSTKGERR